MGRAGERQSCSVGVDRSGSRRRAGGGHSLSLGAGPENQPDLALRRLFQPAVKGLLPGVPLAGGQADSGNGVAEGPWLSGRGLWWQRGSFRCLVVAGTAEGGCGVGQDLPHLAGAGGVDGFGHRLVPAVRPRPDWGAGSSGVTPRQIAGMGRKMAYPHSTIASVVFAAVRTPPAVSWIATAAPKGLFSGIFTLICCNPGVAPATIPA